MREIIKMVLVLTIISLASGGLLAALRDGTQERIDNQVLELVKGPAVREIFKEAANDPIASRFQIKDGEIQRTFFVAVIGGQPRGVALESSGKGYGGDVGLMVGIDTADSKILGVGVTTMSETPGLGARAKSDPKFSAQFKNRPLSEPVKVTQDGGTINAISGATITSRAVSSGVADALALYERLKPQIIAKMKDVKTK
jgi:electron transport complex protein RnfG